MASNHILVNREHGQRICAFLRTNGYNYAGHVNSSQRLPYPITEGWRPTGVLIGCAPDRSNDACINSFRSSATFAEDFYRRRELDGVTQPAAAGIAGQNAAGPRGGTVHRTWRGCLEVVAIVGKWFRCWPPPGLTVVIPAIPHSRVRGAIGFMLPDGALIDERTRSRLGGQALDEVLACLWLGTARAAGRGWAASRPPCWSTTWAC